MAVRLTLYNALNDNTATSLTQQSGAAFLNATAIVAPRTAEFNVVYSF